MVELAHPTQKPVDALRKLIEAFCPVAGLVLDPFEGSGSSLVAGQSLGRRWIGIELDSLYFAAAMKRMHLKGTTYPRCPLDKALSTDVNHH